MPADVKRSRFRPEVGAEQQDGGAGVADDDGLDAGEPAWQVSTLCGLIQRRVLTDLIAAPPVATPPVAPGEKGIRRKAGAETRPADAAAPRRASLALFLCEEIPEKTEWRKMTVRLPEIRHRELRDISQLWGVSYQTLLLHAVSRFLENAVNSGGPKPH